MWEITRYFLLDGKEKLTISAFCSTSNYGSEETHFCWDEMGNKLSLSELNVVKVLCVPNPWEDQKKDAVKRDKKLLL